MMTLAGILGVLAGSSGTLGVALHKSRKALRSARTVIVLNESTIGAQREIIQRQATALASLSERVDALTGESSELPDWLP